MRRRRGFGGCFLTPILILILSPRHDARLPNQHDNGILEIYNATTDEIQEIDLQSLALGEMWTIGADPNCTIRLEGDAGAVEQAALVLTPDGPLLESRSGILWYDGRSVKRHLLFDGDRLDMGRCVIYYHNFSRQRKLDPDVGDDEY